MAVQIARPRDMMMRDPMQGPQFQPNPTQQQRPEPSAMEQFGQMAQNRAMEKGLQFGEEKVMEGASALMTPAAAPTMSSVATPLMQAGVDAGLSNAIAGQSVAAAAPTAAAGTGALTAIGTAMPYVGAGLLAGKALGLFSEGGQVKPTYANMGKMIMSGGLGPLAMKKMKEEGMKGGGMMGLASMLNEGGTAGPLYAAGGYKFSDRGKVNKAREIQDYYEDEGNMSLDRLLNPDGGAFFNPYSDYMDQVDDKYYSGGMAGPLSKIEYKSAGGETYKLSYGGPISKGA